MTGTSTAARFEGFSLAERDRRWEAVRLNAASQGFDCTLVPLCLDGSDLRLSPEQMRGTRSDSRYLTGLENAAVVLPTQGGAPIVITERGEGNAWVEDPRPARVRGRGSWGRAIADALGEAGLERARIGVSGLRSGRLSHVRAAEGVVNYGALTETQRRLPQARFEDATDVIGRARFIKSEEEIRCLRTAAQIAVAGLGVLAETARPGVDAGDLYARVVGHMLALGSEYYPLALEIGSIDGALSWYETPPTGRLLQPGDFMTNETDAVFGGLIAQEGQPLVLGRVPEAWRPVVELQGDIYHRGLELMRPGARVIDLVEDLHDLGTRRGMAAWVMMHSRGYGNDGPLINTQGASTFKDEPLTFEANTVWMCKPSAVSADGRIHYRWGGCVLVTEHGGEPLVRRTPGLLSVMD